MPYRSYTPLSESRSGLGGVLGGSWAYFSHSGCYGYKLKVLEKTGHIHLSKIQKSWEMEYGSYRVWILIDLQRGECMLLQALQDLQEL